MATLPKASTPLVRGPQGPLLMAPEWYRLFQLLVGDANELLVDAASLKTAETMPGNITGAPAADARLTKAQIKTFLAIASGDVSGLGSFATSSSVTITDAICGVIDYPEEKDYIVGLNMPFAFTAVSMTTRLLAGTCTLVTKKDTTAVTGLSNAATTSQVTTTATAGNSFVVGDDVRLTVSSPSATCEGLAFCLRITRTVTP